ncbi:hypothetical protein QBC41DRAFT_281583 [Cercophora samala]|uniref:Uncharacterized protein n=1 Tax=Cercophora samala TaxID=330535 RepID=A0AA40DA10_9PEZI|nr:hypothetical protein QBC41DRAFT_281583 [Cercophora samala]
MSTDARQPRQSGRRRSSALRSPAVDQEQQFPRRRSSAIRRNIETFNRNRAHNVRRGSEQVPPTPRRMTTRSMAREDMEEDLADIGSTMANIEMDESSEEWQPSLVIGSALWLEHEDPTKIEIADRKVLQTRLLAEHYQNYQNVAAFSEMHERAVQERAQLDENDEENTTPMYVPSLQASAIAGRVRALQTVLARSTFGPERANIEAAIAGYESGDITYSDKYTVIWAGRIVDRFDDYESFSNDNRADLLDRYAAEYGPGWIWYEPSLSKEADLYSGQPTSQAKAAICLVNKEGWRAGRNHRNLGHYRLRMAFKRRQEHVSRPWSSSGPSSSQTKKNKPRTARSYLRRTKAGLDEDDTSEEDYEDPNDYKPRMGASQTSNSVIFDTLFDTGATNPCLYSDDIPLLGIDKHYYSAQSVIHIATATGTETISEYELDVAIVDSDFAFNTSVRVPANMSYPLQPPRPMRVSIFPNTSNDFSKSANADPGRLSGLFPLIENYLTSAPGNYKLWLGTSRLEVLGTARLPPEMSFLTTTPNTRSKPPTFPDPAALNKYQHQLLHHPPTRAIFEHSYTIPTSKLPLTLREDESVTKGTTILSGPLPSTGPLSIKYDLDAPSAQRELTKLTSSSPDISILKIPPHLSHPPPPPLTSSSPPQAAAAAAAPPPPPPPTPYPTRRRGTPAYHPVWTNKVTPVTLSKAPPPRQLRERRKGSVLERMDKIGQTWRQQMLQDQGQQQQQQQQQPPPTPSPRTVVTSPRLGKMFNKKGEVIGYVEMGVSGGDGGGGGVGGNGDDVEMPGS